MSSCFLIPTFILFRRNPILVLPVKVMLVVTDRRYSPQAGNSSIRGTLPIRRMRISVAPPEIASAVFNRRWAYFNGLLYNVGGSLPTPSSEMHAMAYTDIHHIRFCEQETRDLVGKSPANEWHYQFEVLIPVERWLKEQKDTTTLDVAAEVEFGWDPDTSRAPAYTVKATEKLTIGRAANNLPVCLDTNSISLPLLDSTLALLSQDKQRHK